MPRISNNVTRAECSATSKIIMEKIDKLYDAVNDVKLLVAKLPEEIFNKADTKYASKEVEEEVKDIKEKQERRNYEWLKYLATALITLALSYFFFK